jgi:hypothetical protein
VGVDAAYIVAPVQTGWPVQDNVEVIGLQQIASVLDVGGLSTLKLPPKK